MIQVPRLASFIFFGFVLIGLSVARLISGQLEFFPVEVEK